MSNKALFHREGDLVYKNEANGEYEPIDPIIENINKEIERLEKEIEELNDAVAEKKDNEAEISNKSSKNKLKQELKQKKAKIKHLQNKINFYHKHSKKLIDLNNTIIIILDTPKMQFLEAIAPLLSQESYESEYSFADREGSSSGLKTKSNILRGCPALISAQAVDYSNEKRFAEINRRQITINPVMSQQKIADAIRLQTKMWGATEHEYETEIVSAEEKEHAMQIVSIITLKLKMHTNSLKKSRGAGVYIPFRDMIFESLLPKKQIWDMTIADRLLRNLTMSTRVYMSCRPGLEYEESGRTEIIAIFDDLKEALFLMEDASSAVRPYVTDWFREVFIPAYESQNGNAKSGRNSQSTVVNEKCVCCYSR